MPASTEIQKILKQVSLLDQDSKIILVEKILKQMKKRGRRAKPVSTLTSLKGMGSEIWRDKNIDKYVEDERQWD